MGIFSKTYFKNKIELDNNVVDICPTVNYSDIGNDGYTVQGLTFANKYIIISAYHKNSDGFLKKSRIYFYAKKTGMYRGFIELDNSAHVGGISYDDINDVLFVTGSYGRVNAYNLASILSVLDGSGKIIKYDSSNLDISLVLEGNVSAATLYFYEGCLLVATCSEIGRIVKYKLRYSNEKILVDSYQVFSNLPACIQGLCLFKNENKLYYAMSQSYGKIPSKIGIYDNSFNFIGQFVTNVTGVEGIDISKDGKIYMVFENSSTKMMNVHLSKFKYKRNKKLDELYISKGRIHQNKLDAREKML